MKIKLADLKPNPFRNFDLYPIFPEWIESLKDSINQTGYWNGFCVREHNGEYQIAYGHHRLEAAKQVYGEDYEIEIEPEEMTDLMMRARMFRENVRNEAQDSAVILHDIEVAKKFPEDWENIECHIDRGAHRASPFLIKIAKFLGRSQITVERVHYAVKTETRDGLTPTELSNLSPTTAESIAKEIRRQKPSPGARKKIIQETKAGNIGPKFAKQMIREIIEADRNGKAVVETEKKEEKPEVHLAIFKQVEPAANKLRDQLSEINKFIESINFNNVSLANFAVTLEALEKEIQQFLGVYDEKKGILQNTEEGNV